MDPAPRLQAGIHLSRAQVALHADQRDLVLGEARSLLALATEHGFSLMVVDGLELGAAAIDSQQPGAAAELHRVATAERTRLGYRFGMQPAGSSPAASGRPTELSLAQAVALVRGSPSLADRRDRHGDALL